MSNPTSDILLLANGPGEVTTWVLPVVQALRQTLPQSRISVVLSPCPHSTGTEAGIAKRYPEVERVLPSQYFWRFLLTGNTPELWSWSSQGVVLFLGGDQFYAVVLAKRLGYRSVIYAEWTARWLRWLDCFAIRHPRVAAGVPARWRGKLHLVGDLMADIPAANSTKNNNSPCIGLFPGSKAAKLTQGVPLTLAIADELHQSQPKLQFVLPLAPTLTIAELNRYAAPQHNPMMSVFKAPAVDLITEELPDGTIAHRWQTRQGTMIELLSQYPVWDKIQACQLCITTVGANTAQLAALGIPMLVLLPTQQLDAMRSWDGLPGLLANLPGVGTLFARLINWVMLKQNRLYAWPNIWAGQEIVPELRGRLKPAEIANLAHHWLKNEPLRSQIRTQLRIVSSQPGAALKIARLVQSELSLISHNR
ncbi:MAG: lipid-A-disaccharide synthase [Cyanobacteria bacterium P01_H01_bin.15]